jgi:hypothetical protein
MNIINKTMNRKTLIRITIVCALLTQINHAAHVFYILSDPSTYAFIMSWVFAVSLETSVYLFTMYGKRNTAIFFSIVSWSLNILYYWFEVGFTQQFVAMNIISPIIPITIYFYSELIQKERRTSITRIRNSSIKKTKKV